MNLMIVGNLSGSNAVFASTMGNDAVFAALLLITGVALLTFAFLMAPTQRV